MPGATLGFSCENCGMVGIDSAFERKPYAGGLKSSRSGREYRPRIVDRPLRWMGQSLGDAG